MDTGPDGFGAEAGETRMDDTASTGLDETMTVEVELPLRHLLKLHSVRALTGRELGEEIADALDEHFGELPGNPDGERASEDLGASS